MAEVTRRRSLKLIGIAGAVSLGLTPQAAKSASVLPVRINRPLDDSVERTVEGYTTKSSFNRTESVKFCIRSSVPYELRLFRLGYYGGKGARLITSLHGKPENIADTVSIDRLTARVSCNWDVSPVTWVPGNAKSGYYVAQLIDTVSAAVQSHLYFVLRNDGMRADLLVASSDPTWQAYNEWGGSSLYVVNKAIFPDGTRHKNGERALEVSYNRPYLGSPNCFDSEWRLIYWLERNGFRVKYCAAADIDDGQILRGRSAPRVLISSGHDEYWTASQRLNVERARDAGIHLAFLSGDTCFWQTRFASASDLIGIEAHGERRLLICLKEPVKERSGRVDTLAGAGWTGYWGEPDTGSGNTVETELTGLGWKVRALNRAKHSTFRIAVPAHYANHVLWRNTGFEGVGGLFPMDTLYYEWDAPLIAPSGNERLPVQFGQVLAVIKLTETLNRVVETAEDRNGEVLSDDVSRRRLGPELLGYAKHYVILFRTLSNSWVFSVGAVCWSVGLKPDRVDHVAVRAQQQFQINVFGLMGCQPTRIQDDLVYWQGR